MPLNYLVAALAAVPLVSAKAVAGSKETLFGDELNVEGSRLERVSFSRLFDETKGTFNVVEP